MLVHYDLRETVIMRLVVCNQDLKLMKYYENVLLFVQRYFRHLV